LFNLLLHTKPKKSAKRTIYNYNKGDFAALRESLKLLPLTDIVLCEDDIDIAWSKWCDTFLAAVDIFIPSKQTSRSYTPPSFTSEIVHLLHQKETTRKRAKNSESVELFEKFRDQRRTVKSLIKTKKREYIKNLVEKLPTNLKEFWKFFKSKSNKYSLPDTMTLVDSSFTTSKAKPDAFNKSFASIFLPLPDNPCVPTPTMEFYNSTEFTPV
jgi:hypothetical protein